MNLRALAGSLLRKVGASLPVAATQVYPDPFNYALASLLQNSQQAPAALQGAVHKEFPSMEPGAYAALQQQLAAVYARAADLASAVNKQQLSQEVARERLTQAFPQLAPANLGGLLLQSLVGTR